MSTVMEEEIKRWTARQQATLVLEIIQGKTTVANVEQLLSKRERAAGNGGFIRRTEGAEESP